MEKLKIIGLIVVGLFVLGWLSDSLEPKKNQESSVSASSPASSSPSNLPNDPYEILHVAFVTGLEKNTIQPILEDVMHRYKIDIDYNKILNVGNMLVVLRKESKVGVTEMDILKHIYQKGSPSLKLPEQAAISAMLLEKGINK